MIERGWGLRPIPFFALGRACLSRRKFQIKPTKINLSLFGRWEEMRMIKAVLFDMDGVLVDTLGAHSYGKKDEGEKYSV